MGFLCGALAFTPYFRWRWEHARHHATSGNLKNRGTGDIWTMTVEEYRQSSPRRRFAYRLIRNPFALFGVGPLLVDAHGRNAFPSRVPNRRARRSVWWTNLFVAAMAAIGIFAFGWFNYLLLQIIIIGVSGAAGIWLFYIQHQFEDGLLGARRGLGLHRRRFTGQFLLQTTQRAAMVLGEISAFTTFIISTRAFQTIDWLVATPQMELFRPCLP